MPGAWPYPTVTTSFVWDMHADVNNATVEEGMGYVGAPFDHAVAALIDDIEARGLRDKILVVCCGEMGLTPVVNTNGGRDHWGSLAPLLLYGGGLGAGRVVGHSTRDGGQPASDPVTIPDLVSLLLGALVDPAEVRRFAEELRRFNTDVSERTTQLQARFAALGDSWQDQEHAKFAEEFKQTMKVLRRFVEVSNQHAPFLLRKAAKIEEYLTQR